MLRVTPKGQILLSQRFTLEMDCQMDFHQFPFDYQLCPIQLESFGYTTNGTILYLDWLLSSHLISLILCESHAINHMLCINRLKILFSNGLVIRRFITIQRIQWRWVIWCWLINSLNPIVSKNIPELAISVVLMDISWWKEKLATMSHMHSSRLLWNGSWTLI